MARQSSVAKDVAPQPVAGDPGSAPVLGAGIHQISAEAYHADPCEKPSLSASIAQVLLDQSPAHARLAHPRLNENFTRDQKLESKFSYGTAAHMLMCEGASRFEIVDTPNWRSEAARDERREVARLGKVALLEHEWQQLSAMVKAGRDQLRQHPEGQYAFRASAGGEGEATLIWPEGPVWCRSRIDWLDRKRRFIFDYKSTDGSARPDVWGARQLYDLGGDLQAAMYRRGATTLINKRGFEFRFVVQETSPPYALSVIALSPTATDIGRRRVEEAIDLWTLCQRRQKWPGYEKRTAYVEPPNWYLRQIEDRALMRQIDKEAGIDPFKFAVEMWKP